MNILNLPEYKIISIHESNDAYRIEVETNEPPLFCTQCGSKANLYKHTKRVQSIMNLLVQFNATTGRRSICRIIVGSDPEGKERPEGEPCPSRIIKETEGSGTCAHTVNTDF